MIAMIWAYLKFPLFFLFLWWVASAAYTKGQLDLVEQYQPLGLATHERIFAISVHGPYFWTKRLVEETLK